VNLTHLEERKLVVMLLVAAGDGDREGVADIHAIGILCEGRAGQHAFGFVADVEEDLLRGDRDNHAFELALAGIAAMRVAALEVFQQIGEGLLRLFRFRRDWRNGRGLRRGGRRWLGNWRGRWGRRGNSLCGFHNGHGDCITGGRLLCIRARL
jgi:hypothetical protein